MATELVNDLIANTISDHEPKVKLEMGADSTTEVVNDPQQVALASLALMAALSDRTIAQEERAALSDIMLGLTDATRSAIYQKVFLADGSIESELESLDSEVLREKAYRLVDEILHSDGVFSPKEQVFLQRLRTSMAFVTALEARDKRGLACRGD